MSTTIYYLFDPLCGWCYGATPGVSALMNVPGVKIGLLPTGLFSGKRGRAMSSEFAAYAWSNDLRITQLTGQIFSNPYKAAVLENFHQRFDSGPATLALTAVFITDPEKEFEALKAIQHARYIDGKDVTNGEVLAALLTELKLDRAADMLQQAKHEVEQANFARITEAHQLMQEFDIHGVPNFFAMQNDKKKLLPASAIYEKPMLLINELTAI